MKPFQIREKIKLQRHVAGSDPDFPRLQILYSLQSIFPIIDRFNTSFYIRMKNFTFSGQLYTLGSPQKQPASQRRLKLVHRLAHSRLGNAEYFRSRRDSSASAYVIKHLIIFEIDFSMFIHLQPPCFLSFGLLQCI